MNFSTAEVTEYLGSRVKCRDSHGTRKYSALAWVRIPWRCS